VPANQVAIDLADEYYVSSNGTIVVPLPYKKGTVTTLPDETFEDFGKIKRMWGYDYTDEYKKEMYELYLRNGGKDESLYLPVRYSGTFEM